MNFKLLTLLLLFVICEANAQLLSSHLDRYFADQNSLYLGKISSNKAFIQTDFNFEAGSTAISNSFIKASIFGGEINNEVKNHSSKHLANKNLFGSEFSFSINGKYQKEKIGILAGIGHRELLLSKFASPLFENIFRGNKMYAGQNVELGNSNFSYLNYDYIYAGINKSFNNWTAYATAQFIRGGNRIDLKIDRAKMFTAEDGDYIDLNTKLQLDYSPNTIATFPSTSGLGTALNLGLRWEKDKHTFNLEIRDIGFIYWKNQNSFKVDSSYRYEGIDAGNLFDQNLVNTGDNIINIDTLATEIKVPKGRENKQQVLPLNLLVNYNYKINEKIDIYFGIRHLVSNAYMPKFTLRPQFKLRNNFLFAPSLNYGGFGRQSLELGFLKSFNNSFIVSCNLFCIEYLIFSKSTFGSGLNFSLGKSF